VSIVVLTVIPVVLSTSPLFEAPMRSEVSVPIKEVTEKIKLTTPLTVKVKVLFPVAGLTRYQIATLF